MHPETQSRPAPPHGQGLGFEWGHRGKGKRRGLEKAFPLTEDLILTWADAHRARAVDWPRRDSGPVRGDPAGGI
jgi:hypothetical protein